MRRRRRHLRQHHQVRSLKPARRSQAHLTPKPAIPSSRRWASPPPRIVPLPHRPLLPKSPQTPSTALHRITSNLPPHPHRSQPSLPVAAPAPARPKKTTGPSSIQTTTTTPQTTRSLTALEVPAPAPPNNLLPSSSVPWPRLGRSAVWTRKAVGLRVRPWPRRRRVPLLLHHHRHRVVRHRLLHRLRGVLHRRLHLLHPEHRHHRLWERRRWVGRRRREGRCWGRYRRARG